MKEDKPPNKGQAESTLVYTLENHLNLSTKDKINGWSRKCPNYKVPLYSYFSGPQMLTVLVLQTLHYKKINGPQSYEGYEGMNNL